MYRRIEAQGNGAQTLGGEAMCKIGLPDARRWLQHARRIKYFFTEYGWRNSGHAVLSEIRSKGVIAKIVAVKENDPRIQVLYRDKWQVIVTLGGRERSNEASGR